MISRLEPMLAVASEPFDSDDHVYEVKWDGVRCLAAVGAGRVRLWGRELADYTAHCPQNGRLEETALWYGGRRGTGDPSQWQGPTCGR